MSSDNPPVNLLTYDLIHPKSLRILTLTEDGVSPAIYMTKAEVRAMLDSISRTYELMEE